MAPNITNIFIKENNPGPEQPFQVSSEMAADVIGERANRINVSIVAASQIETIVEPQPEVQVVQPEAVTPAPQLTVVEPMAQVAIGEIINNTEEGMPDITNIRSAIDYITGKKAA